MAKILIDHNVRQTVFNLLVRLGHEAESAAYNGWDALSNGELVRAAALKGFDAILTQDKLFEMDGSSGLKEYPNMCIVLIDTNMLPQTGGQDYIDRFFKALTEEPLVIVPGKSSKWPSNRY
ncbi:MAG: hypothetical protein WCO71_02820 [Pseudomonadota bacterium]